MANDIWERRLLELEGGRDPLAVGGDPWADRMQQLDTKFALKAPSIERRTVAAGLYPFDENKRRAYMLEKGYDPFYDLPRGEGGRREDIADIIESGVPMGLKVGLQTAGELGGFAVGGVPGFAAGGGLGTGVAQTGIEAYARLRALQPKEGGALGRIGRETAVGAGTSLAGQGIARAVPAVGRFVGSRLGRLGSRVEKFMLTNVTRMPQTMQNWVKGRWTEVSTIVSKPLRAIKGIVRHQIMEPLAAAKAKLGSKVNEARKIARTAFQQVDFEDLAREVDEIAGSYVGSVTSREINYGRSIVRGLEKTSELLNRASSYVDETTGKAFSTVSKKHRKAFEQLYAKGRARWDNRMDDLIELSRGYGKAVEKVSAGGERSLENITASQSFFGQVTKAVDARLAAAVPEYAGVLSNYSAFMRFYSAFQDFVGKDPKQLTEFIAAGMLGDETPATTYAKDAMRYLYKYADEIGISRTALDLGKDAAASLWMKNPEVMTAGVKTFLGPITGRIVGGVIGAGAGAATGYARGGRKGAAVGGAIGLGVTLPYMTPQMATALYRTVERGARSRAVTAGRAALQRAGRPAGAGIRAAIRKPINDAIESIKERFGLMTTEEDLNNMKKSRAVAIE